jgi:hypothetical protein
VREYAIYAVGPSNDHELEIAREVDKHSEREDLAMEVVPEILAFLDFRLSSTDAEFLVRYVRWRIQNPIVK